MSAFTIGLNNSSGIILRDYQHASKTYHSNNNALLPKTKRWFHVYFEISPSVFNVVNTAMITGLAGSASGPSSRLNWNTNQANLALLGVVAQNIKLPGFKFQTKKHNQYNRMSINVDKIDYDPIEIAFHDDTVNMINTFWYSYYQYMIQDPKFSNFGSTQTQGLPIPQQWDQPTANYSSIYNATDNFTNTWGLDTVIPGRQTFGRDQPFFKSIRIYQFNRAVDVTEGATYNEFVLVNPIITSFEHSDLDYSSSEFTNNRMIIDYETVLYNAGLLSNDEIASWDSVRDTFFDNSPSPLGQIEPIITIPANNVVQQVVGVASQIVNSISSSVTTFHTSTNTTSINGLVSGTSINADISVPFSIGNFGSSGNPPVI